MTKEGITHDVVPYFMERFEGAYLAQIQDFVNKVLARRASRLDHGRGRRGGHAHQPGGHAVAA